MGGVVRVEFHAKKAGERRDVVILMTHQKGRRMSPKQLEAVLATLELERIDLQDRIAKLRRTYLIKERRIDDYRHVKGRKEIPESS
jgi:hypothetical protein